MICVFPSGTDLVLPEVQWGMVAGVMHEFVALHYLNILLKWWAKYESNVEQNRRARVTNDNTCSIVIARAITNRSTRTTMRQHSTTIASTS